MMGGRINITTQKLRNQQGEHMAKRKKLQKSNGDTIEVWDFQVEEMIKQGWSDSSAKPKKKSTTKSFNIEEGEE
jgi:hypothetical protein